MIRVLALIALLAGCASPEVRYIRVPVQVDVPVRIPCGVDVPPERTYAASRLDAASSDFDKIKALLIERQQRAGVESELRILLGICTEP